MKKETKFIVILFLISNLSFGQTKVKGSDLLKKLWKIDNTYLKYNDILRFSYYENNKISFTDMNNKTGKISCTKDALDFFFVSDSVFNFLVNNKYYEEENLINIFFSKNPALLLKDLFLDSFIDRSIKVVHIKMDNGTIFHASLYVYKFDGSKSFSQIGYPWSPGQPQMGYGYDEANSLPNSIIDCLKRNNIIPFRKIMTRKAFIYSNPAIPSKSYIVKGDDVEIIEEKDVWIKIRYYGKKTIEGWIKKTDVEK